MTKTNKVNLDFQRELEALMGGKTVATEDHTETVETLKAPGNEREDSASMGTQITTSELFGDEFVEGEIPELKQDFVLLKSNQDRLIEMGQIAQEVFQTKKISRSQAIAIESIARQLIPATTEETQAEERKVIIADNEVNMFTEEPSVVEAQTTLDNSRSAIDRILGDVKNSAIALGEKIVTTATNDQAVRDNELVKGISLFNAAIIKFLDNTEQESLEGASIKFRSNLTWANLMAMPLYSVLSYPGKDGDEESTWKPISSFDGTSVETLLKNLGEFFISNPIAFPVINNFISGTAIIVRNQEDSEKFIKEHAGDKRVYYSPTFGHLFITFGCGRFIEFFNNANDFIHSEITGVKVTLDALRTATDIRGVMAASGNLQLTHEGIMSAAANIAVICAVLQHIVNFLESFK